MTVDLRHASSRHGHGPPSMKTRCWRLVDLPAGCRAAAEPANLIERWSRPGTTEEQLKNNRISNAGRPSTSGKWMAVLASGHMSDAPQNPILNMTGPGMNRWETVDMDLIELARTIHQDRLRQI